MRTSLHLITVATTACLQSSILTAQPGTLDPTFGDAGVAVIERDMSYDVSHAIALQADGKVLVTAVHGYPLDEEWENIGRENEAWRLLPSGEADPSFGVAGRIPLPVDLRIGAPTELGVDQQGRIVIAGSASGEAGDIQDLYVLRLLSNGQLDQGFNGTGVSHATNINNRRDFCGDLELSADGSIYVGGKTFTFGSYNALIAKFNSDGSLDMSFGTNGIVDHSFGADDEIIGIRELVDGKILVAGRFNLPFPNQGRGMFVARFDPTGALDATFGAEQGVTRILAADQEITYVNALDVDADGRAIVAGSVLLQDMTERSVVYRFTPDGLLDVQFDSDGRVDVVFPNSVRSQAEDVIANPDGSLYLSAKTGFQAGVGVARILADGALDTSFGLPAPAHFTSLAIGGTPVIVRQPDGQVLLLGTQSLSPDFSLLTNVLLLRLEGSVWASVDDGSTFSSSSLVFPSPITDASVLRMSTRHQGRTSVQLMDLKGSLVPGLSLSTESAHGNVDLGLGELTSLPAGIYTLMITSSWGREVIRVSVP